MASPKCRAQLWRVVFVLTLVSSVLSAPRKRRQAQAAPPQFAVDAEFEPTSPPEIEATEFGEGVAQSQQLAPFQTTGNSLTQGEPGHNNALSQSPANGNSVQQAPANSNSVQQSPANRNSVQQSPANRNSVQQAPVNRNSVQQAPVNSNMIEQAPGNSNTLQQAPENGNALMQAATNIAPATPKTIQVVVRAPNNINSFSQDPVIGNAFPQAPVNYIAQVKVDPRLNTFAQAPVQTQVNNNAGPLQTNPPLNAFPQATFVNNALPSGLRQQMGRLSSASAAISRTQSGTRSNTGSLQPQAAPAPEIEPNEAPPPNPERVSQNSPSAQPGPMQPVVSNPPVRTPQTAPWVYTPTMRGAAPGPRSQNGGGIFQALPRGEIEAAEAPETMAGPNGMPFPNSVQGQFRFGAEMEGVMPLATNQASAQGLQQPMGQIAPGGQMTQPLTNGLQQQQQQQQQQAGPGTQTAMSLPQVPASPSGNGLQQSMGQFIPGMEMEPAQPREVEPSEIPGGMMGNMMAPNGQPAPGAAPQTSGQGRQSAWFRGNNFANLFQWGQ